MEAPWPRIEVTLFDGNGNRLTRASKDILLSVRDGRQTSFHREFVQGPTVAITTDFHNSPQDAHVVLASMKRHRDAGFMPVTVTEKEPMPVNLMLLPGTPGSTLSAFQRSSRSTARSGGC